MILTRHRWVWWAVTVIGVGFAIYFQLRPSATYEPFAWYQWERSWDALKHLAAYFLLAVAYYLASADGTETANFGRFLGFIWPVMLLGTALETAQVWIPLRNFNLYDIAANILGPALAWFILRPLERKMFGD